MPSPVVSLMANHRSVREFEVSEVPRETVETAVRAAQMASTSSHGQAYVAIRVTDLEVRTSIAAIAGGQRQVADAGAFLVICGDLRRHTLLAERAGLQHQQSLETFLVAVVDASLFSQNLALAFEAEGLGICFIGGLRNNLDDIDRLLGLPDGVLPLYGLAVGKPRAMPGAKPRLPVDAVLSDDSYPTDEAMLELIAAYDAEMGEYYESRGAKGRDWSHGVVRRYQSGIRETLGDYYKRKGAHFC